MLSGPGDRYYPMQRRREDMGREFRRAMRARPFEPIPESREIGGGRR